MADVSYSFGAVDEGVAQAARRLEGEFARAGRAGERLTGTARNMSGAATFLGRQLAGSAAALARFGVAGGVAAGIYGGWKLATSSMHEYMQASEEGRREMMQMERGAEALKIKLGAILSGAGFGGGLSNGKQWLQSALNDVVDAPADLQRQMAAEFERKNALQQELTLARDDGERAFLIALDREEQLFQRNVQELQRDRAAGLLSGPDFGRLMRRERSLHDSRLDELHWRESERRGAALERERELAAEAKRAGDEQMYQSFLSQEADRVSLEYAEREADIDALRAQGLEKEARLEQVRLDTLRRISEVKGKEWATDEAKQTVINRILNAEQLQLAAINSETDPMAGSVWRRRYTGQQSIAPGFASATLFRQVFGPEGGGSGAERRSASSQVINELKATRTVVTKLGDRLIQALGSVGTLGP